MKEFKFFKNNKRYQRVYQHNRWIGSTRGQPKWINLPTGLIFFSEMTSVDTANDSDVPTVNMEIMSKMIVTQEYNVDSYESFLEEHWNHYIWIYKIYTDAEDYTEDNSSDIPLGIPLTISAHIELN